MLPQSWLWLVAIGIIAASPDEYRLLQDLRKEYDPVERPVLNQAEAVNVSLKVYLQQILDIDEKNQMLTMVIWLQYTWEDYKMKWSPEEYGNITEINLPPGSLWRPDILLFNSADENFDARFDVNYVVQYTGHVLQAPPAIVKSSCTIDITWFPFDEQICYLKYGAWTHAGDKINLFIDDTNITDYNGGLNRMDLEYYVRNGEWELIGTPASRITSPFSGSFFVELYYYVYIRRKVMYYGINWLAPSALFLLSNVLGFSLPAECGEKITLQTNNLLSVTVLLGMVADVTPPTSISVPFIGAFFALQMVLLGSSVIVTILVINISFRSPKTHKMTPFLRSVFLEWIPWLTLMSRPGTQFRKPVTPAKSESGSQRSSQSSRSVRRRRFANINRLIRGNSAASFGGICNAVTAGIREEPLLKSESGEYDYFGPKNCMDELIDSTEKRMPLHLLRNTLQQLGEYLEESKQQMIDEEEEEIAQADWRFMAMAIDRACMFVYAFLSIVIPVCMYVATPKESPGAKIVSATIGTQ